VAFGLDLVFVWKQELGGVLIKAVPKVHHLFPEDASIGYKVRIKVSDLESSAVVPVTCAKVFQGLSKAWVPDDPRVGICDLPAMVGVWDEMAWATAGLPASGELAITLTVSQVSHIPQRQHAARHAGPPQEAAQAARAAQQAAQRAAQRAALRAAQQVAQEAAQLRAAFRAAQ
jgi:hypothetical protein